MIHPINMNNLQPVNHGSKIISEQLITEVFLATERAACEKLETRLKKLAERAALKKITIEQNRQSQLRNTREEKDFNDQLSNEDHKIKIIQRHTKNGYPEAILFTSFKTKDSLRKGIEDYIKRYEDDNKTQGIDKSDIDPNKIPFGSLGYYYLSVMMIIIKLIFVTFYHCMNHHSIIKL
jgi:hypothetical protein